MAQQRETIDLRTLQEVHRLLASSDFATADDRRDRVGSNPAMETRSRARPPEHVEPGAFTPLPHRR